MMTSIRNSSEKLVSIVNHFFLITSIAVPGQLLFNQCSHALMKSRRFEAGGLCVSEMCVVSLAWWTPDWCWRLEAGC